MTQKDYSISVAQAQEWLASGQAVLVDVREAEEFKAEHIPYAMSLPLGNVCELFETLHLPKERKIIFQCLRGRRGEQACVLLNTQKTACEMYNMEGGIDAWKDAGLPLVVDQMAQRVSIFRQVQIIVGSLIILAVLSGFLFHKVAFIVAGLLAAALVFAGVTGWCGLARMLAFAPWNKA